MERDWWLKDESKRGEQCITKHLTASRFEILQLGPKWSGETSRLLKQDHQNAISSADSDSMSLGFRDVG
jgi:hypothetical protein